MTLFVFSALILYISGLFLVIIYHLTKKDFLEGISRASLVIGLLSHTIVLAIRTYESGHAPMLAMYETLLFYGWSTVLLSIIVVFRYNEKITKLINVSGDILAG